MNIKKNIKYLFFILGAILVWNFLSNRITYEYTLPINYTGFFVVIFEDTMEKKESFHKIDIDRNGLGISKERGPIGSIIETFKYENETIVNSFQPFSSLNSLEEKEIQKLCEIPNELFGIHVTGMSINTKLEDRIKPRIHVYLIAKSNIVLKLHKEIENKMMEIWSKEWSFDAKTNEAIIRELNKKYFGSAP